MDEHQHRCVIYDRQASSLNPFMPQKSILELANSSFGRDTNDNNGTLGRTMYVKRLGKVTAEYVGIL
jgi:hypothetical protein